MQRRFLDSPWPYFGGAALLLVVAIASQFELQVPSRPKGTVEDIAALREREDLNVVFIVIDTLRADRLGSYGYDRATSPAMDALASTGIRFESVLAQSSWTKTSMASLWTGTHPVNNGIVRFNDVIPEEAVLPAERFLEAGYRTAGIWRNGWVAPNFGFGQGFEFYLQPKPGSERARAQRGQVAPQLMLKGSDEDVIVSARDFLDNFGSEKFLLYLHLMDVHQYVYDDQGEQFGTSYSDVYDQSINWSDRLISVLVGKLDEIGVLQNTVIAIVSDHGEAFREHGWEGHARNLYGEVTRVPVIVSLPFRLEEGIVVDELVSNLDVWPTLLDLVGLPPLVKPDGRSLVPLILQAGGVGAGDPSLKRPVYSYLDRRWGNQEESDPMVSVTDGQRRFLWRVKNPRQNELFDLVADPAEQSNLFKPNSPESEELKKLAVGLYEGAESPWGMEPPEIELDELRLHQLRALGYMMR